MDPPQAENPHVTKIFQGSPWWPCSPGDLLHQGLSKSTRRAQGAESPRTCRAAQKTQLSLQPVFPHFPSGLLTKVMALTNAVFSTI